MSITKEENLRLGDDIKILARLFKAAINEENKEKRLYLSLIIEDMLNHLYRDVTAIKVEE